MAAKVSGVGVKKALVAKPRVVVVSKDVKAALAKHPKSKAAFDRHPYSHQKEYVMWIESAKKPETRQKRIGKMIQMLRA
jgi:uncharacterized protein YdeI (YjbR/CyaY-like superfamily)